MIIEAFREIREAIRSNVEGIHYIDLDRGQLQNPTKFNTPMSTGLVLIDFQDGITWRTGLKKIQRGEGVFSVKTAVRLPDEQFLDEDVEQNLDALEIVEDINIAVLNMGGMARVNTKSYHVGSFYVVENMYNTGWDYEPVTPEFTAYQLKKQQLVVDIDLENERPTL